MSDTVRATSEPETPPAVYDATTLGKPRMFVLGIQHMFAMFGATILVPVLTGLSVSDTLLFAGLGTLLFHILAKGKVPAFLGSSFAFIAGYAAIAGAWPEKLVRLRSRRQVRAFLRTICGAEGPAGEKGGGSHADHCPDGKHRPGGGPAL